jgi:hypothetical protein
MQNNMMSNFGMPSMQMSNTLYSVNNIVMPSMFRDPFENDPFFANSGFSNIDKMMKGMR